MGNCQDLEVLSTPRNCGLQVSPFWISSQLVGSLDPGLVATMELTSWRYGWMQAGLPGFLGNQVPIVISLSILLLSQDKNFAFGLLPTATTIDKCLLLWPHFILTQPYLYISSWPRICLYRSFSLLRSGSSRVSSILVSFLSLLWFRVGQNWIHYTSYPFNWGDGSDCPLAFHIS